MLELWVILVIQFFFNYYFFCSSRIHHNIWVKSKFRKWASSLSLVFIASEATSIFFPYFEFSQNICNVFLSPQIPHFFILNYSFIFVPCTDLHIYTIDDCRGNSHGNKLTKLYTIAPLKCLNPSKFTQTLSYDSISWSIGKIRFWFKLFIHVLIEHFVCIVLCAI